MMFFVLCLCLLLLLLSRCDALNLHLHFRRAAAVAMAVGSGLGSSALLPGQANALEIAGTVHLAPGVSAPSGDKVALYITGKVTIAK